MSMSVEQLFRSLSHGELSNLAAAVDATGAIKKDKQNQVVHFANEALKLLHHRFPLRQSEVILALTGAEQQQVLPADAIQIISIMTPWGESIVAGTHAVPGTFFVADGKLWIPPTAVKELQITYQLRAVELSTINAPADLTQQITLVPELHEALTAHIAYKMFGNMNTAEALQASARNFARFEQVCSQCTLYGGLPDDALPVQKFHERGWV